MRLEPGVIGGWRENEGRNEAVVEIGQGNVVPGITVAGGAIFKRGLSGLLGNDLLHALGYRIRQCHVLREQQQKRKAEVGKKARLHMRMKGWHVQGDHSTGRIIRAFIRFGGKIFLVPLTDISINHITKTSLRNHFEMENARGKRRIRSNFLKFLKGLHKIHSVSCSNHG